MEFLRSNSLIHRDIKPQNILLSRPEAASARIILKIADFGFARALPTTSLASTLCGSPLYMAPEILRGDRYDAKSDLWSLGAVLFECVGGRPPFRAQNHIELLKKIEQGQGARFPDESSSPVGSPFKNPPLKEKLDERLKDLIRKLLKRNPVERISFEEFFLHPCVQAGGSASAVNLPAEVNAHNTLGTSFSAHSFQPQVSPSLFSPPKNLLVPGSPSTDAPFPGYNVSALIFQSPGMNVSQPSLRTDSPDFVMVEHRVAPVKWMDHRVPVTSPLTTVRNVTVPCPWMPQASMNTRDLLLSEEGLVKLFMLWACGIQSMADAHKSAARSDSDWEESLMLYLLALDVYQAGFDTCRQIVKRRPISGDLKVAINWSNAQFSQCLQNAEECRNTSLGSNGSRNIFALLYEEAISMVTF